MKRVDDYVDSLAPQIQPLITRELDAFQTKTIDSLEQQIIDAFRALFGKDRDAGGDEHDSTTSRGGAAINDASVPAAYGNSSLPFADELAGLTRSFSALADGASDDLKSILDMTEGRHRPDSDSAPRTRAGPDDRPGSSPSSSGGFRGFLSAAINVVQENLDGHRDGRPGSGGGGGQSSRFELDGLLGALAATVRDVAGNPDEKARLITPEIKESVGARLRAQHETVAEQFTRIALAHIKRWLRGNTSARDLGEGARGEIEDQVKDLVKGLGGLFGGGGRHRRGRSDGGEGTATTRGLGGRGHGDDDDDDGDDDDGPRSRAGPGEEGGEQASGGTGFSKVISDKLSTGLAKVHREVRLEFRTVLGTIERELFELLPDQFQRPLEKVLGGNPFDEQLDRDVAATGATTDRGGLGDDIKAKLVGKIRNLVRKVQEMLRERILGVVNGGHRKFERESWVFVQDMVEKKVQRYLPRVKISVPDDIGNEGVSVGAPAAGAIQLGGGNLNQNVPPVEPGAPAPHHYQQHHQQGGSSGGGGGGGGYGGGGYVAPPPPASTYQQHENSGYRPDSSGQQFYPPPPPGGPPAHQQQYPHHEYRPHEYNPQTYNPQTYQPGQGQHGAGESQSYGENPRY